eukprot:7385129-Prymnesium_polylepis.2
MPEAKAHPHPICACSQVCDAIFAVFKTDPTGRVSVLNFSKWLGGGTDMAKARSSAKDADRPLSGPSLELRDKLQSMPTSTSSMLWPLGPIHTFGPSRNSRMLTQYGFGRLEAVTWTQVFNQSRSIDVIERERQVQQQHKPVRATGLRGSSSTPDLPRAPDFKALHEKAPFSKQTRSVALRDSYVREAARRRQIDERHEMRQRRPLLLTGAQVVDPWEVPPPQLQQSHKPPTKPVPVVAQDARLDARKSAAVQSTGRNPWSAKPLTPLKLYSPRRAADLPVQPGRRDASSPRQSSSQRPKLAPLE